MQAPQPPRHAPLDTTATPSRIAEAAPALLCAERAAAVAEAAPAAVTEAAGGVVTEAAGGVVAEAAGPVRAEAAGAVVAEAAGARLAEAAPRRFFQLPELLVRERRRVGRARLVVGSRRERIRLRRGVRGEGRHWGWGDVGRCCGRG